MYTAIDGKLKGSPTKFAVAWKSVRRRRDHKDLSDYIYFAAFETAKDMEEWQEKFHIAKSQVILEENPDLRTSRKKMDVVSQILAVYNLDFSAV